MTATPTFLQAKNDTGQSAPTVGIQVWKVNLPNPSQAGNCIVIACGAGAAGATITVSDDKSNTWTSTTIVNDNTNNQSLQIFYALNVAANTQKITVDFGAALSFNQVQIIGEFNNIVTSSASDGQNGQNQTSVASGGAITSGSITTTVDGDLVIQAVALTGWTNPASPRTWTAGSGMTMAICDGTSFMACQYQVQSAHGAINPSISLNLAAARVLSKTIVLKASSSAQGSGVPAGVYAQHISVTSLEQTAYITATGTAFIVQIPCSGNTLAVGWTGKTPIPSSVTSSPSLTWNHTTAKSDPAGSTGNTVQWWYAAGASAGTLYAITFNFASTPATCVWNAFDIAGLDSSSPFDTSADANGTETTLAPAGTVNINGPSLTTNNLTSGCVLSVIQEDQHTATNVSPGYFEATDVGVYSSSSGDTDEGLGLDYTNPNTTVSIVWTYSGYESGVTGVQNWASQSIAFKAAPSVILYGTGQILGNWQHPGMGVVNEARFASSLQQLGRTSSAPSVLFRKTLSPIGSHTGGREVHNTD